MKAPLYRYPFSLTFTSRTKLSRAKVKALLLDALTSGGIDERDIKLKAVSSPRVSIGPWVSMVKELS